MQGNRGQTVKGTAAGLLSAMTCLLLAGCGTWVPCHSIENQPSRALYWTQPDLVPFAAQDSPSHDGYSGRGSFYSGDLEGSNGFWIVYTDGYVKVQLWSDGDRFPPKADLLDAIARTFEANGWPAATFDGELDETSCG